MAMDWFSWLSKTGLEPSLVYEYGLAFAHNELEEDDISHFDHEFLQSMGISIAKHRLEILKLAKKEKRLISLRPMSRLIAMIKKTQKFVVKYVHAWVRRDRSAIIVVPRKAYGKRWRGALLKRNKRMMLLKQRRLMITNGKSIVGRASPVAYDDDRMDQELNGEDKVDGEVGWSNRVDEIRWASMFQNLQPT